MVTDITNCNLIDEFLNILETKSISTLYQPIISLKSGEVLGYEALSRGPQNSYFYPPDKLFFYAKKYFN